MKQEVGQATLAGTLAQVDLAGAGQPEQQVLQEELADPTADRSETLVRFWSVGGKRARQAS